jgi:hypothetical protein
MSTLGQLLLRPARHRDAAASGDMEACRLSHGAGRDSRYYSLDGSPTSKGTARSCQRGSNGLADRVTSAEYVRERPSREPCGALAYSSDEQYSSSATRTLSVHRRCGIAAREGPMTRLRASIPLRDRRGLVDDSVGWCLVRTGGCDCGREASGRSALPAAPSTT